jgi:hypothetical protein
LRAIAIGVLAFSFAVIGPHAAKAADAAQCPCRDCVLEYGYVPEDWSPAYRPPRDEAEILRRKPAEHAKRRGYSLAHEAATDALQRARCPVPCDTRHPHIEIREEKPHQEPPGQRTLTVAPYTWEVRAECRDPHWHDLPHPRFDLLFGPIGRHKDHPADDDRDHR